MIFRLDKGGSNMEKTNILWTQEPYIGALKLVVENAYFLRRAAQKGMHSEEKIDNSHIISREEHMRMVSEFSRQVASRLNLNAELLYVAMLMHDAGHPFSTHEGEGIISSYAQVMHVQFYHHNSKGLEVIEQEEILDNAIGILKMNHKELITPNVEKKLREEWPEFLDIVISHDGEIGQQELVDEVNERIKNDYKKQKITDEYVYDKAMNANARNQYKAKPGNTEGQLGKLLDTIAYLGTDIQDAFRELHLADFDDDYLEIIGKIYLIKTEGPEGLKRVPAREQRIDIANKYITEIQKNKVMETEKDSSTSENKELIDWSSEIVIIIKKQMSKNPKMTNEEIEQIIEEGIAKYEERSSKRITYKDVGVHNAQRKKIKQFVKNMIKPSNETVSFLTQSMQSFLLEDIISTTQKKGTPTWSDEVGQIVADLKLKNLNTFVLFARNRYQTEISPKIFSKMVDTFSKNLYISGVVRNKMFELQYLYDTYQLASEEEKRKMEDEHPELKYLEEKARESLELRHTEQKDYLHLKHLNEEEMERYPEEKLTLAEERRGKTAEQYIRKVFAGEITNLLDITKERYLEAKEAVDKLGNKKNKTYSEWRNYNRNCRIIEDYERINNSTLDARIQEESRTTGNMITYIGEKGASFVKQYMYTFNAVETRVRDLIERALKGTGKKNPFYEDKIQEQLAWIREDFAKKYSEMTKENIEQYIVEQVERERSMMEYKMCVQYAMNYMAGMSDKTIQNIAIEMGFITREQIEKACKESGRISEKARELSVNLQAKRIPEPEEER